MFYFLLMPLNLVVMLLCYFTNPIVCLFANEEGELPGVLKYWQTWDDSCDSGFFVKTRVNSIFRYDYDSKYEEYMGTTPELSVTGNIRRFVKVRDGATFSFKERIQRYFCRVLWLTRNNGYGFAFYIFGVDIKGCNLEIKKDILDGDNEYRFAYDRTKNILIRPWVFYYNWQINDRLYWNIYLGWKISTSESTSIFPKKAMIANRISIRIGSD